ncbi:MAG: hypothetical protein DI570_16285 [Phenylobacterium zucineum]|nr:MAG: hypothetical protein DI570_16285 [Phenylobacterium zucineum]
MDQATIGGAPARRPRLPIHVVAAWISALLVFVGFAPSYYLKGLIQAPPPLSPLTMAHGALYTAWVGLFLAQAQLIAAGRPMLHRRLGMLGAMLFGAMMVLGLSTAITAGRLGHAPPGAPAPLVFMALPVFGIVLLTGLVGAALVTRDRPAVGRLFIPAGVPHWQMQGSFVVIEALLLAVALWDSRREGRFHPAWTVSLASIAVSHAVVSWAFTAPGWWTATAAWLTR